MWRFCCWKMDEDSIKKQSMNVKDVSQSKRVNLMSMILLTLSYVFLFFAIYILIYGLAITYGSVCLRMNGVCTSAKVGKVVEQFEPDKRIGYIKFPIVAFATDSGDEIEARISTFPGNDIQYSEGDSVDIIYNGKSPAIVLDMKNNTPLNIGIFSILVGIVGILLLSLFSRYLISAFHRTGTVISIVLMLCILVFALYLFIHQNVVSLYRYLPNKDEAECFNNDGVMYSNTSMEPFSGRMKSGSGDTEYIYSYRNGLLDGLNVVYSNGRVKEIGHWEKGLQNGLFSMYTTSGILVDYAYFSKGERNGLTRQFDAESGSLLCEGNYKDGLLDGKWVWYYPDGKSILMEQTYSNGMLQGMAREYYDNGQLHIDMNYIDGEPSGSYKSYYPNGNINVDGFLENGSYSIDTKFYSEDGSIIFIGGREVPNDESDVISIMEESENIDVYGTSGLVVFTSDAVFDALDMILSLWKSHDISCFDEYYERSGSSFPCDAYTLSSDNLGNVSCELAISSNKILRIDVFHSESGSYRYATTGFDDEDPIIVDKQIPLIVKSAIEYDATIDPCDILIRLVESSEDFDNPAGFDWHYVDVDTSSQTVGMEMDSYVSIV